MSTLPPDAQPQEKCRLAEILQYRCDAEEAAGKTQMHCLPVPRIFRICQNRPAVEITRFIEVDLETGAVHVPPQSSEALPKGKPWRDVVRYDDVNADDGL